MKKALWFLALLWSIYAQAQPNYSVTNVTGFENPVDYSYINGGVGVDLVLTVFNSDDDDESEDLAILYLTEEMILDAAAPGVLVTQQIIDIPATSSIEIPVYNLQITTEQFRVGGNIVVIWPSYVDPLTDTLEINVNVNDTLVSGYREFLFDEQSRKEVLKALHQNQELLPEIESIEIYTLKGELVRSLSDNQILDRKELPNCILLVRVKTQTGTIFSFVTRVIE